MVKTTICLPLALAILLSACGKKEKEQKVEPNLEPISQADTAEMIPDTSIERHREVPQEPIQVVKSEDGNFTVQVSSWQTRKYAELDAQRFRNHGYDAYIQKVYLAERNETWFRVRIGRLKTKQESLQLANELAELLESGYWLDKYRAEK